MVSDAEVEAGRGAGPECLLNENSCFTICRLCVLSKWLYFCLSLVPDAQRGQWGSFIPCVRQPAMLQGWPAWWRA